MDFSWFRDLDAVARTGSFSKAAMQRHISQPALTRRIKAIESWAGFLLVNRNLRPVTLTPSGAELLESVLNFFQQIEKQKQVLLAAGNKNRHQTVRFTAQHSLAWNFFPDWLQSVEQVIGPFPSRMRADDLTDCIAAFNNHEIDFMIAHDLINRLRDQHLETAERLIIGTDLLLPVCACDEGGRALFTMTAPDQPFPLICYAKESALGQLFHAEVMPRLKPHRPVIIYQNSMSGTLLNLVKQKAGVAWLPYRLVAKEISAGELAVLPPDNWKIELKIAIFSHPENRMGLPLEIWQHLQRGPAPVMAAPVWPG